MPTDLGVVSERKRKTTQAQTQTEITILLVCVIITLVMLTLLFLDQLFKSNNRTDGPLASLTSKVGLGRAPHTICLWLSGLRAKQEMLPLLADEVRTYLAYGELWEVGRRAVSCL